MNAPHGFREKGRRVVLVENSWSIIVREKVCAKVLLLLLFFCGGNREESSALFFLLPRFILWLSRLGTRGLLGLFWQGFWHDLLYWYFLSFFQVWEGFNDFAIFKFAISQHCQTKRQIGMALKNGTTKNLKCLPRRAHFFSQRLPFNFS